eukprot:2457196-Prymnesium_polylepis.1
MSLWHCMLCATRSAVARAPCWYATLLESVRGRAPRSAVPKVLGRTRATSQCSGPYGSFAGNNQMTA